MSVVPAATSTPDRFMAMRRIDLLATPGEECFDRLDRLHRLACRFLPAPVALISLIDQPRSRPACSTMASS
jgi:hypothetical protein